MKKRIISLILAVVVLALSLVGCAYNYSKDDLGEYVSYNEAEFVNALKAIEIELAKSDFHDDGTRNDKVHDAMYAAIAAVATNTSPVTTGKPGAHDKFYYCYYVTYEKKVVEGETEKTILVQGAPTYMDTSKVLSLQLGNKRYATDLDKKISELAPEFDFSIVVVDGDKTNTTSKAYSQTKSGKAEEGQVAFITYSYSYIDGTDAEGKDIKKTGTVTLERVVLDKNNPLHAKLIGYDIAKEYEYEVTKQDSEGKDVTEKTKEFTIPANQINIKGELFGKDLTITSAKVDYVVKGEIFAEFQLADATGTTSVTDINGEKFDVANKDLTYHVYAQKYTKVDELNAYNIVSLIYASDFDMDVAKSLVFGADFADKSEDEQKALLASIAAISGVTAAEGETVFETAVNKIIEAVSDASSKKSALSSATNAYNTANTAHTEAENALKEKPDDEALKTELAEALKNKEEKKAAMDTAQTEYDAAVKTRDELIKNFVNSVDAGNTVVKANYEKVMYKSLEDAYRAEIRSTLAIEIAKLIEKNVTVTSYPKKAVDEAYDLLIKDYQYYFYNGNATGADGKTLTNEDGENITNYTHYNGKFQDYLVAAVSKDVKTVASYKEAKEALRGLAQEKVAPVLKYSFIAEKFGQVYENKDFRQYKKDNKETYKDNELMYGDTAIRNGLQFEKLMNHFLDSDEVAGNSAGATTDYYKNVVVTVKK